MGAGDWEPMTGIGGEDNIGGEKLRELRCLDVGGILSIICILKFPVINARAVLERVTVAAVAST